MKNGRLRRVLVVFQFAVSILLIVGTMVMYRQINYMLNKDVGFNKEQLIVINRAEALGTKMKSFKECRKEYSGSCKYCKFHSCSKPCQQYTTVTGLKAGMMRAFLMVTNWVDYNYLDTYGMTLASGRFFNESYTTDKDACLVNESTVKNFGITDLAEDKIHGTPRFGQNELYACSRRCKEFQF